MSTAYRIDKGVPIPEKNIPGKGKTGSILDFLKELEVGDSVFLKTSKNRMHVKTGNYFRTTTVASYIHRVSSLVGMKWTYRTRSENNTLGIRVWRIS
tara:strand:- start:3880 stop:4170 length:291 start_codon:yes stop_codon:yes gene_type:complete